MPTCVPDPIALPFSQNRRAANTPAPVISHAENTAPPNRDEQASPQVCQEATPTPTPQRPQLPANRPRRLLPANTETEAATTHGLTNAPIHDQQPARPADPQRRDACQVSSSRGPHVHSACSISDRAVGRQATRRLEAKMRSSLKQARCCDGTICVTSTAAALSSLQRRKMACPVGRVRWL